MGERHAACALVIVVSTVAAPVDAQVLSAVEGVRETSHRVAVHLGRGVARVDVEMRFESTVTERAELRYRLPIDDETALASLEVCSAGRCFRGRPDRTAGESIDAYNIAIGAHARGGQSAVAHVRPGFSRRHRRFLDLRAAPVAENTPLEVRLSYVTTIETHAGRLSYTLPTREADPRTAPHVVEVTGADGTPGALDSGVAHWAIPSGTQLASAWTFQCGAQRCARLWLAAAHARSPRDVIVLVDRSPSMLDVPEGRVTRVLEALRDDLHPTSRIRVIGFGRRAAVVAHDLAARELDVRALGLEPEITLGAATVVDSTAPFLDGLSGREPLVIIVGDGLVGPGPALEAAMDQIGATLSRIDVSNRSSTGGTDVLQIGALADAAGPELRRAVAWATADQLAPNISVAGFEGGRRSLGAFRAGEALFAEGPLAASTLRVGGRPGLIQFATDAPAPVASGLGVRAADAFGFADARRVRVTVSPRDMESAEKWRVPYLGEYPGFRAAVGPITHRQTPPVALGPHYGRRNFGTFAGRRARVIRCGWGGCRVSVRGSLSRDVIRRMMERAVEPKVRQCFARERRGRADWSVRAVYTLLLQRREVPAVAVAGEGVSETLEACMIDAVDQLVVPRVDGGGDGVVIINYPFVAESLPEPSRVALDAALGDGLDRLFTSRD